MYKNCVIAFPSKKCTRCTMLLGFLLPYFAGPLLYMLSVILNSVLYNFPLILLYTIVSFVGTEKTISIAKCAQVFLKVYFASIHAPVSLVSCTNVSRITAFLCSCSVGPIANIAYFYARLPKVLRHLFRKCVLD